MKSKTQTMWLRSVGALVAAGALILGMSGCNGCGSNNPAPITNSANGADPADANLATADGSQPTQVMGQSAAYTPQQSSETYNSGQQAPAPIVNGNNSSQNEAYNYNQQQPEGYYDNSQQAYDNSSTDQYTYADQAPPELPVYEQPPAPDDNDLWTPGYWGYANTGYYWVPGAWVSAPYVGALWTPGYWGYYGNRYRFHHGFWGRHIGYYGGINYGYGFIGSGYYGGYWNRDHFYYNREVTRVSPRITNVYEHNVVVNNVRYTSITTNRVSYNGGRGGVNYQPRPYEVAAMHEQHIGPVPAQREFHQQAAMNRANFYADNHGRPAEAALAAPVRTERIAAPPEVNRGGFGRAPVQTPNGTAPNGAFNQHNPQGQQLQMEQQRNAQLQQRNQVEQQRGLVQQQHNQVEQQRGLMEQQRNQNEQQRNVMEQQRNQQLAQHNQVEQQRGLVQQQHNQQLQQNNVLQQQRAAQMQSRNEQQQQHIQQMQQNRSVAPQQPRAIQEQPHPQPQQPQHFQQQQQPRMEQPRTQMNAQPRMEQHAMPAPQQHMEAPRAAPTPTQHMEAPRAAGPPAGEGGHPGGGGHH